jgi:hypothetical protein
MRSPNVYALQDRVADSPNVPGSSTEPRASASGYTTRPTGTGASVPRRSRSPLLSTQSQSPCGQSEPVPRFSTVDSSLFLGVFHTDSSASGYTTRPTGTGASVPGDHEIHSCQPNPSRRVNRASLSQDSVQSTRHSVPEFSHRLVRERLPGIPQTPRFRPCRVTVERFQSEL